MVSAACRATEPDTSGNPCTAAKALRPAPALLTVAEEADIAARVLPGGFGGLYERFPGSAGNGTLVIYLQDLSKKDEVAELVPQLLRCGGAYPGWLGELVSATDVTFRQGRYTGSDILSFFKAVQPLRDAADVWGVANDPEANGLWIGLRSAAAVNRLQQAVAQRGVPLDAVMFEVPPPSSGAEAFVVTPSSVAAEQGTFPLGGLGFALHVRYTNNQASSRYPDWCVGGDPANPIGFFAHTLEQWDGSAWRTVYTPICDAVLLAPREIAPGEQAIDSIPFAGARRLNSLPAWETARIEGTYRLVAQLYTKTVPIPPYLADLAPLGERAAAPFHILSDLPF